MLMSVRHTHSHTYLQTFPMALQTYLYRPTLPPCTERNTEVNAKLTSTALYDT